MKKQMQRILGFSCALMLTMISTGCDSTVKGIVIDQLIGFASSITSAATTSLIQSWFGTTAS
jgi:hypothetical protein